MDTSVIVAALDESDSEHSASRRVLLNGNPGIYSHALSETFSTLTGGRLGFRVAAKDAFALLRDFLTPRLKVINLTSHDLLKAYAECEERGVRGGAIYDFLHLSAARKAGAKMLYTLNVSDFEAFSRPTDPDIAHP